MSSTKKKKGIIATVLSIVGVIVLVLIVLFVFKACSDMKLRAEDAKNMVKTDEELIGEHFYMKRDGKDDVDLNIYMLETETNLPLVINIHGGAFIAGDADTLDTQSDRISKSWNAHVVTVNYKLAVDGITKDYAVEEVVDTVKYFIVNAETYHIDTDNIFIMGYSAGGYHAMASTLELHKQNITVKGQILCYAFLSDMLDKYPALTATQKSTMPSALFILADDEPIGKGSLDYEKALRENGVSTEVKVYDGAIHGFIEENNPEYEKLHFHDSKSPEQEVMARDAEDYIKAWINKIA